MIFFGAAKGKNIIEFVCEIYTTWSGRWMGLSYFFIMIAGGNTFQNTHYYIFIYYCLTFLIFSYSVHTIIHIGITKLFDTSLPKKTTYIYSILFIASFYFFTFQHIEAWWWVCASFWYLQGIVFFLLGIALLLQEKKNILHYIFISLCFIYVGGSFEVYILIIFTLFISVIFYFLFIKQEELSSLKNNYFFKGFIIAFLSFCVSAAICFASPGNKNRQLYSIDTTTTFFADFETSFTQLKYLLAIGISALWIILGVQLNTHAHKPENTTRIKKALTIAALPLLLSIIITFAFQILILSETPIPARGWTFTSLTLSFFAAFYF